MPRIFRIHRRKGKCCSFFALFFRKTVLFRITYWKQESDRWMLPQIKRSKYSDGNGLFFSIGKLWIYRNL